MELIDKKIGFALCGSFCTFKRVLKELEALSKTGAVIYPIMSEIAYSTDTRFGTAEDFKTQIKELCSNDIIKTVKESEPIGPKGYLDVLVIAPCTGNTLAKLESGIADSSVTMAAKAHLRNQKPLVIAVSTNELVIIELSRENLVKSRVLVLSSYFISLRANTNSFKSQNIIMEGCANDDKNNRSMQ